jgi:hypothetical protein
MVGQIAEAFPTFSGITEARLFAILVGLTIIYGVISIIVWKICDRSAREQGLIDWTSNY